MAAQEPDPATVQAQLDCHSRALGKLIANLLSLEFIIRAFLFESDRLRTGEVPQGGSLAGLQVGASVPEDPMTSYKSLGPLVEMYNAHVVAVDSALRVDAGLKDLRDALAHGRVFGVSPLGPLHLVKFGRPSCGRVRVTHAFVMTGEWFRGQIKRVGDEVRKVQQALSRLQGR